MTDGIWAYWFYDLRPIIYSVYKTELEAWSEVHDNGFGYVIFVHWGETLIDAIRRAKEEARYAGKSGSADKESP